MDSKPERRRKYESKSVKLGRVLARLGLTANAMTALSIVTAIIGAYFVAFLHDLLRGLLIFVLAVIFDVFDGAIARATGTASKFGTLIDHTTDRVVEFLILFSLARGGFLERRIAMFTYFGMIMPSYVRARGESLFGKSAMSRGLMERKEKLSLLLLGVILTLMNVPYPLRRLDRMNLMALIVGIGSLITAVQRLVFFRSPGRLHFIYFSRFN